MFQNIQLIVIFSILTELIATGGENVDWNEVIVEPPTNVVADGK
jgi:hypothetical protein